ncbi:MAG TPA: DUF2062 domain-containing protein [Chitinispirillaceae bacterium]|nr:DUF2062 domain-containing protein [Chitinispirillaceae bacterium]
MVRIVIVIPVFNNVSTIHKLTSSIKKYHEQVIVVNDGSTDGTSEAVHTIDGIQVIEIGSNQGKGAALRAGFLYASKCGFTHAITVDADGKYLAEDIKLLITKVNEDSWALWTGQRRFKKKNGYRQPLQFRFGNILANLWFYLVTGYSIKDAQCGLRAYPLDYINKMLNRTGDRYEFALQILILAAWQHLPIKGFPVHVSYPSEQWYVTHFRPVRDFIRIIRSMGTLFFPSGINSTGFSWKRLIIYIKNLIGRELRANTTPFKVAASLGIGVFLAVTPFHGLQVLLLLIATIIFKLNRPLGLLGVSISSPPLIPFWFAAGTATGRIVLPENIVMRIADFCGRGSPSFFGGGLMITFVNYFIGSILLAIICGVVTFSVSLLLFRLRYIRR